MAKTNSETLVLRGVAFAKPGCERLGFDLVRVNQPPAGQSQMRHPSPAYETNATRYEPRRIRTSSVDADTLADRAGRPVGLAGVLASRPASTAGVPVQLGRGPGHTPMSWQTASKPAALRELVPSA
jgi:hypothetical protein